MRWGLGIHLKDINLPEKQVVHQYFVDLWADMWMYTFSVGLSKFVVLGFYWRNFSRSIIRQPIHILLAFSAGWIIVRLRTIDTFSAPISKFWNQATPGTCRLTPMMSLFGPGIPHFIIEVAILPCPLVEIWRQHMPTARKLAVAAMFMSGVEVCLFALGTIIHTVQLARKREKDLTWDSIDDQIWAACDINLASSQVSIVPQCLHITSTKAQEGLTLIRMWNL
ncbi:hypothetical protein BCR34DRAFT_634161 [Clohesyomyces aquaticus]|uniref:Rhodopsin domain-containing protein n=1 Tax=Clohesyomyces aquaticus TaxID=1231657 RepID=A0A1Y1Z3E8_9PLEO|nr:hypothetical protein BCR34DRAFT_634161 [Clohesyomyces aquaticus]